MPGQFGIGATDVEGACDVVPVVLERTVEDDILDVVDPADDCVEDTDGISLLTEPIAITMHKKINLAAIFIFVL